MARLPCLLQELTDVTPPLARIRLTSLDREQLNSLLGFSPTHLFADGTQSTQEAIESFDTEWAHWLLIAALFLAFFEVGLAFWCSRGW